MTTAVPASLSEFVFAPRAPGIVITLITMHGDTDAYTRQAATFPLTDAGRAEADQLLRVIEYLPTELGEQCEYTREFLYEQLEESLGLPVEFFVKHLNDLLPHDCTYQDYYAKPMAYLVDIYDEAGGVQRAQFKDYYGDTTGMRCFGSLLPRFYPEAAWPT
jgi:hypothetical protein